VATSTADITTEFFCKAVKDGQAPNLSVFSFCEGLSTATPHNGPVSHSGRPANGYNPARE